MKQTGIKSWSEKIRNTMRELSSGVIVYSEKQKKELKWTFQPKYKTLKTCNYWVVIVVPKHLVTTCNDSLQAKCPSPNLPPGEASWIKFHQIEIG